MEKVLKQLADAFEILQKLQIQPTYENICILAKALTEIKTAYETLNGGGADGDPVGRDDTQC